jgi:lipoate---protein ligase
MLKLNHIISTSLNPYHNLALEENLLDSVEEDQCILFLWQNKNTVVVGKNQNAFLECRIEELEMGEGFLARRLSGGGAVYHDGGNLNFTFIASKKNYNVDKQLNVILRALSQIGINGEKTGRNDLTIDGKKFSGNAFYERGEKCFHHGTLLVDVSLGDMGKYLNVSKDKLESKGVKSVQSRVTNLKEFNQELSIDKLKNILVAAYSKEYGIESKEIIEENLDIENILELTRKYKSKEWKLGKIIDCQKEISERFPWGAINLRFKIKGNKVDEVQIFSDSLEYDLFDEMSNVLRGVKFSKSTLETSLKSINNYLSEEQSIILEDAISLINNSFEV